MIAKLMNPFSSEHTLVQKIDYNTKKLEEGLAEFLYDSSFKNDIYQLFQDMKDVGSLNDRVQNKYNEVILSLVKNEELSSEKFLELALDYMEKMGLSDTCFNIWRHNDKEHAHLHILFTTVQFDGKSIDDSFSKLKSQKLSRELERAYGLEKVVYNKFQNESLNAIKSREYYFDNALKKGLRGYNSKTEIQAFLKEAGSERDLGIKRSNSEWESLLGKEKYEALGSILEKYKLFNNLFKDELIGILDALYDMSVSKEDFFNRIKDMGLYVRMVSNKGNHSYTYGFPDLNIYFADKQLPLRYRYESLMIFGKRNPKELLESEQKNRIYNKAFIALKNSSNFEEYIKELQKNNVTLIPHENSNGVYGISFMLTAIKDPKIFKASEISRKLSYGSVMNYFNGLNKPITVLVRDTPTFISDLKDNEYLYEGGIPHAHQHNENSEDFLSRKRKKRKGRNNQQSL